MTFKPTFLDVQFGHKSPLLEALELIGPAMNEEHFQARLHVVALIVRGVMNGYENRALKVHKGLADVRQFEADLAAALAGTEFTAKVLQRDSAHQLVVDVEPKNFIPGYVKPSGYHVHDCDKCTPLGSYASAGSTYDLYYCAKSSVPTVVARYGNEGPDYTSGLGSRDVVLLEAERRARGRGLL